MVQWLRLMLLIQGHRFNPWSREWDPHEPQPAKNEQTNKKRYKKKVTQNFNPSTPIRESMQQIRIALLSPCDWPTAVEHCCSSALAKARVTGRSKGLSDSEWRVHVNTSSVAFSMNQDGKEGSPWQHKAVKCWGMRIRNYPLEPFHSLNFTVSNQKRFRVRCMMKPLL